MTHKKRRKRHIHQPPHKHVLKDSVSFNRFGGDVVGHKKCTLCPYEITMFDSRVLRKGMVECHFRCTKCNQIHETFIRRDHLADQRLCPVCGSGLELVEKDLLEEGD